MSQDPTEGLSERELWNFAGGLLGRHRGYVGEVVYARFKELSFQLDHGAMRRWMQVMDMIELLLGPCDGDPIH